MSLRLNRITYIFFLSIVFISISFVTKAQDMNDEFKKKLKESLLNSEMKHSQQRYQRGQIDFQQKGEVLRVSPTTKLPTRLDKFLVVGKMKEMKIDLNLGVTNAKEYKIRTAKTGGGDFDPVRAILRYKARKRQEKVDKIVKAYEME